ncbi:MAG: hypothetical protein GEU88_00295 [Solirubrobacterales bacterium]|nr:hypothetical protein [Solirubrobacterales bacterium]
MRPTASLLVIATAVVVALLAASGGYGYHRDELYFVAAGDHLAWRSFSGCRIEATIANDDGVDNQERGEPVWLCDATRRPWSELWPRFRELG